MIDRVRRDFDITDIAKITDTYHSWCGQSDANQRIGAYKDISGFCYSANMNEIKKNDYVLTPGRYVGFKDELNVDESFKEKFELLKAKLKEELSEGKTLEKQIISKLDIFKYD